MRKPSSLSLLFMAFCILALSGIWSPAVHAAPGEELVSSSGSLSASQLITIPLYSPEAANLRLQVSGGSATDTITMALRNGSTTVSSWVVRSGETVWGYATLPSGGSLTLQNNSGTTLTYNLKAYARGVAPNITTGNATWSGVARGAGIQSNIQLTVPTAGRYRLTFGATGGSFQLKVDSNAILKTAVPGKLPAATDSVYYLSAGVHTFTIVQNSADALVTWSVALATADALDTFPTSESSAVLGGAFREEWVPIQLASAQAVNVRIEVTGATTDHLLIELYNGATRVYTSTNVYGGEVAWASTTLAAGANRLRVVSAASNTATLGYTVTMSVIPQPNYTWTGTSYGITSRLNQGNSSIKLNFPKAGLYRFTVGASTGRFQLLLNSQYFQKIITDTASTNLTVYVPAGAHTLQVRQDPAQTKTTWSVQVATTTTTVDSLTFSRGGGTLGGTGNAFRDEWIPLQVNSEAPVNLRVVAQGAASDSLKVELYNGNTLAYSAAKVYGGETFWATTTIKAGSNRLRLIADAANTGPMSYLIEVRNVDTIPGSWRGVALSGGLNSVVRLHVPADGIYDVELTFDEGAGQVLVDANTTVALQSIEPAASTTTLRVPLKAGLHTFTLKQDTGSITPRTVWQIATKLRQLETTQGAGTKAYLSFIIK